MVSLFCGIMSQEKIVMSRHSDPDFGDLELVETRYEAAVNGGPNLARRWIAESTMDQALDETIFAALLKIDGFSISPSRLTVWPARRRTSSPDICWKCGLNKERSSRFVWRGELL